MIYYRTTYRE